MSDKVYIEGPNGLVIGHERVTAEGLLKHKDHKKVAAPAEGSGVDPEGNSTADKPAGNASLEVWQAYALANGKTSADLDGLKQGEIRALFTE